MSVDEWYAVSGEWPPPELRLRGALLRGAGHARRREFFAAYRAFLDASRTAAAGDQREFARGLVHLAAAGYKRARGDEPGASRQHAHARRRLEPFRPSYLDVEVDELLGTL
jgi:hypothetical protein